MKVLANKNPDENSLIDILNTRYMETYGTTPKLIAPIVNNRTLSNEANKLMKAKEVASTILGIYR